MAKDKSKSKATDTRLHIGAISAQLAADVASLETRLAKFGEITKPLELHQKPTAEDFFGYVTVRVTPEALGSLKKALNGVKFKGSVLSIAAARPDWRERWAEDHKKQSGPVPLTSDQAKRLYEPAKREIDVIPGRMRTTPRRYRADKRMTVRILFGDRVKRIAYLPKKKLWGMMKGRELQHLVSGYSHGKWTDGNGDVVEVVDFSIKPYGTKTASTDGKGIPLPGAAGGAVAGVNAQGDEDEDDELKEERERNLNILQGMFDGADDLPRPMKLSDDEEDEGKARDSDSDEDEIDWDNLTKKQTKIIADADFADSELAADSNDNSYNDKTSTAVHTEPEKEEEEEDTGVNSTNKLRSLFNPTEDSGTFSLFGGALGADDEDDIQEDVVMHDPIETPAVVIEVPKPKSKSHAAATDDSTTGVPIYAQATRGLFFPHFDSPYLNSQSQLASLTKHTLDNEEWHKKFYEMRGEWNRTFRRRRRDVVKQIHRSNKAKRRTAAI